MIVCSCHRISDRDIAQAAREGCASFEELQKEPCVAIACGACHDCARETFQERACVVASAAAVAAGSVQISAARITVMHRLLVAQATGA